MSSIELNRSMGIDVSEYELRSSYSCSRMAWTAGALRGEDRKPDSFYENELSLYANYLEEDSYLACCEHSAHLTGHGLIAAQIRATLEDEADVVEEVVSRIRLLVQAHGEAEDLMALRSTDDESSAECLWRYHILGDVVEMEQEAIGGRAALLGRE